MPTSQNGSDLFPPWFLRLLPQLVTLLIGGAILYGRMVAIETKLERIEKDIEDNRKEIRNLILSAKDYNSSALFEKSPPEAIFTKWALQGCNP